MLDIYSREANNAANEYCFENELTKYSANRNYGLHNQKYLNMFSLISKFIENVMSVRNTLNCILPPLYLNKIPSEWSMNYENTTKSIRIDKYKMNMKMTE